MTPRECSRSSQVRSVCVTARDTFRASADDALPATSSSAAGTQDTKCVRVHLSACTKRKTRTRDCHRQFGLLMPQKKTFPCLASSSRAIAVIAEPLRALEAGHDVSHHCTD